MRLRLVAVMAALLTASACWGSPPPETLADSSTSPTPVPTPTTLAVSKLVLETDWGCILYEDHTLSCWGDDPFAALEMRAPTENWTHASRVEGVPPFVDIASGGDRLCGIEKSSGTVACWGRKHGVAGPLRITDMVEIAAGGKQTCARDGNGVIRCGGIGEAASEVTQGAISIALASEVACALDAEGGVWCWWIASYGPRDRFVTEGLERRGKAVRVARVPGAIDLDLGTEQLCVRLERGELQCTVGSLSQPPYSFEAVAGFADVVALDVGQTHGCAIRRDSSVRCFGANDWAQLGVAKGAKVMAASPSYSCAAGSEGIHCWGTRSSGYDDARPVERHVLALAANSLVIDDDFGCVTNDARVLTCWGARDEHGANILTATPREIARDVDPLVKLEGPCVLERDGDLRCDLLQSDSAPPPNMRGVTDFTLEHEGLCAVVGARVECWRRESWEPLPSPPRFRAPVAVDFTDLVLCAIHGRGAVGCATLWEPPKSVPGLNDVVALTQDQCALDRRGRISCWGYVTLDDDSLLLSDPREIEVLPPAVEAVVTDDQACIRTEDGRVACVARHRGTAMEWLDVAEPVQLAAGDRHVCVRDHEGNITCVGDNRRGELGAQPSTVMLALTPIVDCSKQGC